MTTNKRRKVVKYRGSKTHGGGSKKKRRGAGHHGGRGMAGTGKRADQKKPTILKLYGNTYFGKHGFKRTATVRAKAINVGTLNDMLPKLVAEKKATEEEGTFVVDLKNLGFDKLLGSGKVTKKIRVKANAMSHNAVEKIKALGGEALAERKEEMAVEQNESQ